MATDDYYAHGDDSELLLQELNHRIFNTFQIIAGQAERLRGETQLPKLRSKLQHLSGGLFAFANLHRSLLPNSACDNLCEAVENVCNAVIQGFSRPDINIAPRVEDVPLSALQRHRVLLIAAELVTNALKHSFSNERGGSIRIEIRREDRLIFIETWDSSRGANVHQNARPSRLVEVIAQGLGGNAAIFDRDGFATRVTFPLEQPRPPRAPAEGMFSIAMRGVSSADRTISPSLGA